MGGFSKSRVPFLGGPIIQIIAFWVPYWVPLFWKITIFLRTDGSQVLDPPGMRTCSSGVLGT